MKIMKLMKITNIELLFLVFILPSNTIASPPNLAQADIDASVEKIKAGNFSRSDGNYEQIAELRPDVFRPLIEHLRAGDFEDSALAVALLEETYHHLKIAEQQEVFKFLLDESESEYAIIGIRLLSFDVRIKNFNLSRSDKKAIMNRLKNLIETDDQNFDSFCIIAARANVTGLQTLLKKIISGDSKGEHWEIRRKKTARLSYAILGNMESIDILLSENTRYSSLQLIRNTKVPHYLLSLLDDSKSEEAQFSGDVVIEPYNYPIRQALMEYFPEMAEELGVEHVYQLTNEQVRQWVNTVGIPNLEKEIKESKVTGNVSHKVGRGRGAH